MLVWLADVLRAEGLEVIELDGWETRSRSGGIDPQGLVWHHTATPVEGWTDEHVARLLRDGRSDLPGPLSQLGLDRKGRFWVIAAGRCNHNGYGTWGNDSIGIEAFNDGIGEEYPAAQLRAWERGSAAICRHMGWSVEQVLGHKESDPSRKIDPIFDMEQARARVAALLTTEEHDLDDTQAKQLAEVHALLKALVPNTPRKVVTTGADVGQVSDAGKPAAELWRWALWLRLAFDPATLAKQIAEAMPPSSGQIKVTDIEAALRSVFADAADG